MVADSMCMRDCFSVKCKICVRNSDSQGHRNFEEELSFQAEQTVSKGSEDGNDFKAWAGNG